MEDLDKPVSYVFAKVMVTYVDLLGTRAKLWKPSELQWTGVILKNFAVYVGLGTDDLKTLLANVMDQKYNWKYVSQGLRHGDRYSLSSGQSDLCLQLGCPNDWTSCIQYDPATG